MPRSHTSLYVSLPMNYDDKLNAILITKRKTENSQLTKNEIVKDLIIKGLEVEDGKYLKINQKLDKFIQKLRNITLELDEQKFTYEKSTEEVYYWLIEKGLKHIQD